MKAGKSPLVGTLLYSSIRDLRQLEEFMCCKYGLRRYVSYMNTCGLIDLLFGDVVLFGAGTTSNTKNPKI
jgi:hypothetical protein